MSGADYPLLLVPHLARRVWGGDRLGESIGEAWDLSAHSNGPSTIANGPLAGHALSEVAPGLGLLAKRLDCAGNLSVQVHPRTGDPKTEAWVVLEAEEGAGVYHGFSAPIDAAGLRAALSDGSIVDRLRFVKVRPGDCVFVPSGTVHAIGAGLLLFELQQSADTTYRLYDWGREREMHVEQGLACADLDAREAIPAVQPLGGGRERLVACEHFHIDRVTGDAPLVLDPADAWTALLLTGGRARLGELEIGPGQTVLIPASAPKTTLEPLDPVSALVYGPPAT
ncbi:MAG: class I mannose-6-phosphate isomerase [Planctomycetota bacterium]|jgi:mannose-6-phosphate isomerase